MKVIFLDSKLWSEVKSSKLAKTELESLISETFVEVCKILPSLSKYVNILVRPSRHFIPETDNLGYAYDSETIFLYFNPKIPKGLEQLKTHLRSTIFHELNHAARYEFKNSYDVNALENSITEGLACAFERKHVNGYQPWDDYSSVSEQELKNWLKELKHVIYGQKEWDELLFSNPDGRKWVAYKAGTWVVEKAAKNSGKEVEDMLGMNASQVLKLAKINLG